MALVLFGLAIRLLLREARNVSWPDFVDGLLRVDPYLLGIAVFLVALNYVLLSCYDILALRYVCRPLPLRRVVMVGFLGFALGNNLGSLLAATPIRYRFYHRWGLSHSQIMALIGVIALTFWSGLFLISGIVLTIAPIEIPKDIPMPIGTRTLGIILLTLAIAYFVTCHFWRKPWPIGKLHLRLPQPGLAFLQASVSAVDLVISATALYLVLPSDTPVAFPLVLGAFLVAITASILTQVPGGLVVLELILLSLLIDKLDRADILASLIIFRTIYYFIPLLFGMVTLMLHEIYSGAAEARADAKTPPSDDDAPCGDDSDNDSPSDTLHHSGY